MKIIIAILFVVTLIGVVEAARTTITHTAATVTNGGSSQVLAANINRNFLMVRNIGANDIFCKFGATAVANQGDYYPASGGGAYFDDKVPTVALNCIAAAGSNTLLVSEGTGP